MSHVPAGMYFGGDSGDEYGGFDFGDSPDSSELFPEEPTLASIVSGPREKPESDGGRGRSTEGEGGNDGDGSAAVSSSSGAAR